jgi:acyl-homoserine lactone acylase PvdQ
MSARRLLPAFVVLLLGGLASPAVAAGVPSFGGFHSVLAFGEGQNTSAGDLAAFEAGGTAPASDLNQQHAYEGLEQAQPTFGANDLATFYKDSSFQPAPSPSALSGLVAGIGNPLQAAPAALEEPQPGVTIARDAQYGVPRIYASTRAGAMWAAGYVTAEDRLFFMDVLRHTAEGTTAALLGSSAAAADSAQLGVQDTSPQELTHQMESLPQTNGADGSQALADVKAYVDGINAYIQVTQRDPVKLPAEYPALGISPQPWTLADTASLGVYLIGQFTVFGGPQPQQAEALGLAIRKLGARLGPRLYRDLRLGADPEAEVTLSRRFASDPLGRPNPASEAIIDPGTLVARDAVTGLPVTPGRGVKAAAESGQRSGVPAWAQTLARTGIHLPHHASNAVLVTARRSRTGQALAVMGPQVGYYTPEVFLEYEMHAPGIDISGVSFPGSSPYPLIGHGADFAWTGTSAYSANEDVFAERLCNPDRTRATFAATHYLYKGRCVPFTSRTVTETTPVAPTSPSAPTTITLHTLRSVHGPVPQFATVRGTPVALAISPATLFHETPAYVAFMRLAENRVNSPQSFIATMHAYPGSENWFYVDRTHIAVLQSGWFPLHARGSNPDLPIWGTGRWDWRGYDPATHAYRRLPASANPAAIDPPGGILVNWNNAIAHGWRVAAGDWENGPVHRATILRSLLLSALRRGPLDLAGITKAVTALSLTEDLRGLTDVPLLSAVIGRSRNATVRSLIGRLDAWSRAGSQRRDLNSDNTVDDSPAVLLMDTWWPLLVRAEFQPAAGKPLMDLIDQAFNRIQPDGIRDGSGNGFFAGWEMDVQKDLRQVLRRRVRGRFSRTYCGGGSLTRCRSILTATLLTAYRAGQARYGANFADWKLPVTCPVTTPPSCDQIVTTAAGALQIPNQPFDNRGTFYQAVAVNGHR